MRQKKLSNRKYYRSSLAALFLSASVSPGVAGAQQDLLREPQVLASENNVLDLVMVANARLARTALFLLMFVEALPCSPRLRHRIERGGAGGLRKGQ